MKNLKKISIAFTLLVGMNFTFQSCQKDEPTVVNPEELFKPTEFNLNLNDLAFAVSKAVNDHEDLRKIIKQEALFMFDGDYDILMKNLKNKTVINSKTKKISSIKDLLISYYPPEKQYKGASDIIDELTELYPDLQITVPVNAENWDDNFVPKVSFLSEEYDEQTQYIPGYKNGEILPIDAINVPDEPVIVISLNERIIPGDVTFTPPCVDIILSGSTTESGIRLNWVNTTNVCGPIYWYKIYRKYAGQANFTVCALNNGQANKTFDDINIIPNFSYSYYITANNEDGESEPSNIVNVVAPNNPNSVLNFDATQMAFDDVELRWDNDYSEYFEGTKVFKRTISVDSDYYLFGTYNSNTHYVIDNNLAEGKRVNYKVHQYSTLGLSNPKYDFIQVPYRDISQISNVYVEKVKFDDWSVEQWPAGKPEFRLTVAGVNPMSNQSYSIQNYMELYYQNSHSYQSFNQKNILPWKPSIWYDMISLNLVEHDRQFWTATINMSAKYKRKDSIKSSFQVDGGVDFSITIGDLDENCGNAYYTYYDPSTQWIYFPNYGARIKVSETDVIEPYNTTDGF